MTTNHYDVSVVGARCAGSPTAIRGANRETRIVGTTVPNYFRQPYGPSWALIGDAGYNKAPITAQGISDAFRDAERCATALGQALSGARSFGEAMSRYQTARDEHALPMYEFTTQLATLQPPPEELRHLLAAVHGNQEAVDSFADLRAPRRFSRPGTSPRRQYKPAAGIACPSEEEKGTLPCPAYAGSSSARAAHQAACRCCATHGT